MKEAQPAIKPLSITIEQAALALGIGKTLAYDLVNKGVIPSIALGSRRVVPVKLLEQKMEEWSANARNAG